jgi:hypothetical protein
LLLRPAAARAPKQDQRGFAILAVGKQRAKVGIGGHKNAILFFGRSKYRFVVGRLQSLIPHVGGIVSNFPQPLRQQR